MGVKVPADDAEGGGGPAGVVEGWSALNAKALAPFLELLSGVAGEALNCEEPNSDQRKEAMVGGGLGEHSSCGPKWWLPDLTETCRRGTRKC